MVCHGIPGDYELREGDIVNVDITSIVDGWFGDQSETFVIGEAVEKRSRSTEWLGVFSAVNPFAKTAADEANHPRK